MQSLLSEAAIIPSLLQQIDVLLSDPCSSSSEIANMLSSFIHVLNSLQNWESRLRTEITERHYWSVVRDAQSTGALPDDAYIWFPNITMANVYTHLWAFGIICLDEINKITLLFPSFAHEDKLLSWQFDFDHIQEEMMGLSKQICLSMEYLNQDRMRLFGPASTFFPLRTAYRTFKTDELRQRDNILHIEATVDRLVKKGLQSAPHIVYDGRGSAQVINR